MKFHVKNKDLESLAEDDLGDDPPIIDIYSITADDEVVLSLDDAVRLDDLFAYGFLGFALFSLFVFFYSLIFDKN